MKEENVCSRVIAVVPANRRGSRGRQSCSSNASRGAAARSLRSLLPCDALIALNQTKQRQFFTSTGQRDTVSNFVLLVGTWMHQRAPSRSLSLARSLSLSHYCFAPSEAARVRDAGNRSLPGVEGKFDLMHLSSLCQHFGHTGAAAWGFLLPLSVPVEPGRKVQQLLLLGAQRLVAAFI